MHEKFLFSVLLDALVLQKSLRETFWIAFFFTVFELVLEICLSRVKEQILYWAVTSDSASQEINFMEERDS